MGKRYVYAVVSRRAKGVSIGINLNPNNACNWRCIYCQVPDLARGKGPTVDLALLQRELDDTLDDVLEGDFMAKRVPEGARVLRDVAFSGNGEPTTSPSFRAATELIIASLRQRELLERIDITLITNGTMLGKAEVQAGVKALAAASGRVWFKLDAGTAQGTATVNGQAVDLDRHLARLRETASLCETWVQTCMFAIDGEAPAEDELEAYLDHLRVLAREEVPLAGVHLYTIARPSQQPEAPRLSALSRPWLDALATRIEAVGLKARVG